MKKKVKKWLALAAVVMGIFSTGTKTAFAYTDEAAQAETPAPAETEAAETEAPAQEDVLEETEPEGGNTPFSVPGNGQLVDDIKNDGTKQFLTIQTKNGNTFFVVLDRSSNTENVYMLSMVDENDLKEFIEDGGQAETEEKTPQVVIPETDPTPVQTEPEKEAEPEPEKGGNMGAMVAIAILFAGAVGGIYYVKVVKPKKAEEGAEDENLEMYDGGRYINEDQEPDLEPDEDE